MEKMGKIQQHPVMVQILADSFGGVMYNVANKGKYNTNNLLSLWDNLTDAERSSAGGSISGAIAFIKS